MQKYSVSFTNFIITITIRLNLEKQKKRKFAKESRWREDEKYTELKSENREQNKRAKNKVKLKNSGVKRARKVTDFVNGGII